MQVWQPNSLISAIDARDEQADFGVLLASTRICSRRERKRQFASSESEQEAAIKRRLFSANEEINCRFARSEAYANSVILQSLPRIAKTKSSHETAHKERRLVVVRVWRRPECASSPCLLCRSPTIAMRIEDTPEMNGATMQILRI